MPTRELLPTDVRPKHYSLTLTPDLEAFTFSGSVDVTLTVNKATSSIVLNAKHLSITSAFLNDPDNKALTITYSSDEAFLAFASPVAVTEKDAFVTLHLEFSGELNDQLAGFYRSSYTAPNGDKKYMAVTQFEATDARRAFPCWDEPALKATFDVTLIAPKNCVALSNMPAISESEIDGGAKKKVKFATTPVMSTYILAFAVSELDYIEAVTKENVKVRVYTPPGVSEQGRFALDVAVKTLSFFTDYFAEPYPLPKLDLLAVPDFSAGAMENFGLVTFRTVLLLFNEQTTPVQIKQRIAYVVGHELAHQWFGNLVTMEWWTDLWLNEGFATWVGWLAVAHLFPDWNVWEQFIINEMKRALSLDALQSSHPVEVEVPAANKVDEIFDAISYAKGACVIRMLVSYLGEDEFKKGIRKYIKQYLYSNASTADLWRVLGESSGKDVKKMMDAWTAQTGYPVVKVEPDSAHSGKVKVCQCRFLSVGPQAAQNDTTKWIVPVRAIDETHSTPSDEVFSEFVSTASLPSEGGSAGKWFKLNAGQTCFYRVQYHDSLIAPLGKAIPTLPAADRVGIVNDAFALASAGYASTTQALTLLSNYNTETAYTVWEDIISWLRIVASAWYKEPEAVRERIRKFALSLVAPMAQKVGWNVPEKGAESHLTSLLRPLLLSCAGAFGDSKTVEEARARFDRYHNKGDATALHADVRGPAFATVIAHGGEEELNAVLAIYRKAESSDLQTICLSAIGHTRVPALSQKVLELSLSEEVRSQDLHTVVATCASNRTSRDATWKFVKDNWKQFNKRLVSGFLLLRIVSASTENLVTLEDAADIEAFFKANPMPSIERNVNQSLEHIKANHSWLSRDREAVKEWLEKNVQ